MRGKKIIAGLHYLLKYVLYINLALSGGLVGFQIMNLINGNKLLVTFYLGKFDLAVKTAGILDKSSGEWVNVFMEQMSGSPSLIIDNPLHPWLILFFTMSIAFITLFYNYQLYKLFKELHTSVTLGSPFNNEVSKTLKSIAVFSIIVFLCGLVLTGIKLLYINSIVIDNFVAKPAFDNGVLNFLWVGLGAFVLNEIYKVGLQLKNEQDFTI